MELKKKAISSVKWVTAATVINNGIQLLLVTILARYLSPVDFGLMALVQVVVEFSSYFIDMGFNNIIIYKQDISRRQLSSLYWLNIFTGIIIFLIIFVISPWLSVFYKAPELEPLLNLVGITFILIPIGQQHKTILQKELKFDIISRVDILSRTISGILAIALGIKGFGVYSLAIMVISNSFISSIVFLIIGLKTNKPDFVFSHNELKSLYSFGMFQLGERTLNYFSGQFDTIIIGKILGPHSLGIYTIAKNLVMKPQQIINPIVTRVAFPIMAKFQNDTEKLKKTYISTTNYLASINFPLHLSIAILAEPLTILLFGKQWIEAVVIVKILALFAMIRSVYNPVGSLLLAKGRADLGFYWILSYTAITPIIIFTSSLFGLIGVSFGQLFLFLILLYPFYLVLIKRLIGAKFWEYHSALVTPLLISITACILPYFLNFYLNGYIIQIVVTTIVLGLIYLLISYKFNKNLIIMIKDFGAL
jgi:O-antigen/teichoic acid export membrane protein